VPDPVTPTLRGPSGTINDNTPLFIWTHDKASFRYELLIRDMERNENIVIQVSSFGVIPDGNQAYYNLPADKALRNSTYRWWVRAFNSMGTAGGWSNAGTFVIRVTEATKPAVQPLESKPLETLMAALPERTVRPESQSAAVAAEAVQPDPAPVTATAPLATARVIPAVAPAVPAAPADAAAEQLLIDEALWRMINPAAVVQS